MSDTLKIKDTEQTKRLREFLLNNSYNNLGEMYQLLNYEVLHNLVKKIKKGNVKIESSHLFEKSIITKEEKFLDNLDKFIDYVKNTYFIHPLELNLLIEVGLENKYSKILYSDLDFHVEDNFNIFYESFRKMFLFGFYNNLLYYSKKVCWDSPILKLLDDLREYKFDDAKGIIEIEKILSQVFSIRHDNLYDSFVDHSKFVKNENFQISKIEWIISDYYQNYRQKYFEITQNDNFIVTNNSTTLLFNIHDNIKKLSNKDWITIEFGVQNSYFTAKVTDTLFTKKEFIKFYKLLKEKKRIKSYDEDFDLINSTLKFNFWGSEPHHYLDITFTFMEGSTDSYKISLGDEEIDSLLNIIELQTQK